MKHTHYTSNQCASPPRLSLSMQQENFAAAHSELVGWQGTLDGMQRRKRVPTSISICIFSINYLLFRVSEQRTKLVQFVCLSNLEASAPAQHAVCHAYRIGKVQIQSSEVIRLQQLFCLLSFLAHISVLHKILFVREIYRKNYFHLNFELLANK